MKTFRKIYNDLVVDFNDSNEYIEMGASDKNPTFAGIVIRKQFSSDNVELFPEEIEFFFTELNKIVKPERGFSVVKLIHKYGWNNHYSTFAIIISDFDGVKCKFFTNISHMYNSLYDAIRTNSPEFNLEEIIKILADALFVIKQEK